MDEQLEMNMQTLLDFAALVNGNGVGGVKQVGAFGQGQSATKSQLYGGWNIDANECCPPLFDPNCGDQSIYTFYGAGNAFMRWLGVQRARSIVEIHKYLPYIAPDGTGAGTPSSGVPAALCDFGEGVEMGEPCEIRQSCFGVIKRKSPKIIDGGMSLPYCESDPRFTIDGTEISNEYEWLEAQVTDVTMNDVVSQLMVGAGPQAVSGVMSHWGLLPLMGFNNGNNANPDFVYECDYIRPSVLDWAGNMACNIEEQAGITLNGQAVTGEFARSIYRALQSLMMQKMKDFSRIFGGNVSFGDVAIIAPMELFECLIRCAVCDLMCDSCSTVIDNEAARGFYQELLIGGVGFGEIRFGNFRVPLIPYEGIDWATGRNHLKNADGTYNMLVLWRGNGSRRFLQPQYNPLDDSRNPRSVSRDNGQFQLKLLDTADDCECLQLRTEWRWLNRAPFLNCLITNIACDSLVNCDVNIVPAVAAC